MKEFDQTDPVWKLLGHGKKTEASPWFASRVMSNLPKANPQPTLIQILLSRWLPGAAIACVFLLALGVSGSPHLSTDIPLTAVVDFEIIQDLDLYMVKMDSTGWTQ